MQQHSIGPDNFDALTAEVAAALNRVTAKRVVVGMRVGPAAAYMLKERGSPVRSDVPQEKILLGCLSKLFTAELARKSMQRGSFRIDEPIAGLLGMRGLQAAHFAGVEVRHLLEHTHGLDGSAITQVPLRVDGCIDIRELSRRLANAGRLSEPGALHSYGDAGAWLLAAILEQIHGAAYERLLTNELLEPLALRIEKWSGVGVEAARICPATGGSMALSIEHLLAFFGEYACSTRSGIFPDDSIAAAGADVFPMPGWCQFESGIHRGWKCYGPGWFGHNAKLPGYTVVLRVQPRRQFALMVASEDYFASGIAARLFGDWVPQLRSVHIPALLSDSEALACSAEQYVGTYANAACSVSIDGPGTRELEIEVHQRAQDAAAPLPLLKANLRPAKQHVFFTQPPNSSEFPFVQFIAAGGGRFTHLWNGKSLWRRQERSALAEASMPAMLAVG